MSTTDQWVTTTFDKWRGSADALKMEISVRNGEVPISALTELAWKSALSSNAVSVKVGDAEVFKSGSAEAESYLVTNDHEWARIFIHEQENASGTHSGYISVVSTFGDFGYHFTNVGTRSLKTFLIQVKRDYMMHKLMGSNYQVFEMELAISTLKTQIFQHRKDKSIDAEVAREFYDLLDEIRGRGQVSEDLFHHLLSEDTSGLYEQWELWDNKFKADNPQAVGFWDQLWSPFVTGIKSIGL